MTTLDALIGEHGEPAFCKIDVEGYEMEVLKGLSRPLACLSFEYIPAAAGLAAGCIRRLESLGSYEYNLAPGESMRLRLETWAGAETLLSWLEALPANNPSGDIYARRKE
jgi:hypothetical protein